MQIRSAAGGPGNKIRQLLRSVIASLFPELGELAQTTAINSAELRKLADLLLQEQTRHLRGDHPNPLNRFGRKCFSQTDEDGITLEILRRIGNLECGTYAEFGVGNGTENNTLILAALGWKGFWVGGEDLAFASKTTERFIYLKNWITLDNVLELTATGLSHLRCNNPDVVSLDLDGNDIYFLEKLLLGQLRPKLFIVEYNAKFPPPVEFRITYDPQHKWGQDDYFGASLCSFVKLLSAHGYRLICCNTHTGANAFFIASEYAEHFPDVPTDIRQIYVEPRYFLYHSYGHKASSKVIERIFGNPG